MWQDFLHGQHSYKLWCATDCLFAVVRALFGPLGIQEDPAPSWDRICPLYSHPRLSLSCCLLVPSPFQLAAGLGAQAKETHLESRGEMIAYFSCYFIFIWCRVIPQSEQDEEISLEKKKKHISMEAQLKVVNHNQNVQEAT